MSDISHKLSSKPPEHASQNFAGLKEQGLEIIREIASETWTDHNLHDPGITFLESYAYALTDIGFRAHLNMQDLIRSGEKIAPHGFPAASEVLPCAPVTEKDFRKLLLDHMLINDVSIISSLNSELQGLYDLVIELSDPDLNSNTYPLLVDYDGDTYTLDIALPHWDEPESASFIESVNIASITMIVGTGGIWRSLEETATYFARVTVGYDNDQGSQTSDLWLVVRISDEAAQSIGLAANILSEAETELTLLGPENIFNRYHQRVMNAHHAVNIIYRYINSWRNLCEIPMQIQVVRTQEIAVKARLEINNGIDLELLVAKIFDAIDAELSPLFKFSSLQELQDSQQGSTDIFDGPLLQHGFLSNTDVALAEDTAGITELYLSDILRLIMQVGDQQLRDISQREAVAGRDILAVSDLTLSNFVNNRLITKGARDCLKLVDVSRYRPRFSLLKSRITLVRDEIELNYDMLRVSELYEMLVSQRESQRLEITTPDREWPVSTGTAYDTGDYLPFQQELPGFYGVGDNRLPDSATIERRSQAMQTKGYLLLSEQILSDSAYQLSNINHFFSPRLSVQQTYFPNPVYEIAEISKLIKDYNGNQDWQQFVKDDDNAHRINLRNAIETRETFLDRRNRMLDHLLARQGLEALAWSQEMHRRAYQELKDAGISAQNFQTQLSVRRQDVNQNLILLKEAFLNAAPELNANRLQSFQTHSQALADLISLESTPQGYQWRFLMGNEAEIVSSRQDMTRSEAWLLANDAVELAAQEDSFQVQGIGGGRFAFLLYAGVPSATLSLGQSQTDWASQSSAQTALQSAVQSFLLYRLRFSISPFERMVAFQCGLRDYRRELLTEVDDFFEIYDEVDTDGVIEKRWRLWSEAGYGGNVLLSSVFHFVAPPEVIDPLEQETAAISLAGESISRVLQYGIYNWNYRIADAGPDSYNFELIDTQGTLLAIYAPGLEDETAVRQAIQRAVDQLQHSYSAEGFHMVEHILLRPQEGSEPPLNIPINDIEFESDPYSHRISLVFPSGSSKRVPKAL